MKSGIIRQCKINGDFFAEYDIADVISELEGIRHTHEDINKALEKIDLDKYFLGCNRDEVISFLAQV